MLIDKEVIKNCKRAIEYFEEFGEQEVYFEEDFDGGIARNKLSFLVTRNFEVYQYWSSDIKQFSFTKDFLGFVEADEEKEA